MKNLNTDILIVGCGPAGLSAALATTIRKKETIVCGGKICSPKLNKAPHISNYLGFWNITGEELRKRYLEHMQSFAIEINKQKVDNIYPSRGNIAIVSKGETIMARAVILATGLQNFRYLPGEEDLIGRGVGYCATCDGPLYKDKRVGIVSYNQEGEQEANFLAELAKEIIYLPMYTDVGQLNEKIMVSRQKPKSIVGQNKLEALETDQEILTLDGLFIIRESAVPEQILPGLRIEKNSIFVDRAMATNIEGVFACGDCTGGPYQLAKAVGEGTVAGLSAASYIDKLNREGL